MKTILLVGVLFLSLLITGCSSSTSSTTTGPPPPPTGQTNFVYVANSAGSSTTVSALVSDPSTGALTSLTLSPYNGGGGFAVKAEPAGKYLYVTGSGDISAFSIDAGTGGLTPTTMATFPVDPGVDAIAIDPTGKFLYAVSQLSVNLYSFSIDSTTGALTQLSTSPIQIDATRISSSAIAIDPSGKFLFASAEDSLTAGVYVFSRDLTTGALTSVGAPVTVDHGAHDMATDPAGKFVLVPATGSSTLFGTLTVFSLNTATGALTLVGSPTHTGPDPSSIAIDPSGKYVYTANTGDVTISAFTLDSTSGALTAVGSPISSGGVGTINGPTGIAVESSGSFVYVCNASNDISVFKIGTGGALSAISGSPFPDKGNGPHGIAVVKKQ